MALQYAQLVYTEHELPEVFASQHVLEPIIPTRRFFVAFSVQARNCREAFDVTGATTLNLSVRGRNDSGTLGRSF